jgi:predicted N-formylglutamate amidohydrolase
VRTRREQHSADVARAVPGEAGAAGIASRVGPRALRLARGLARGLRAPLIYSTTSRLLVELNRSVGHRHLFSEVTRGLPRLERELILERHYRPYRGLVEAEIESALGGVGRAGRCCMFRCIRLRLSLGERFATRTSGCFTIRSGRASGGSRAVARGDADGGAGVRVRMNYPYRGAADGLTTHLRRRFPASRYLGIELEVNQALAGDEATARGRIRRLLTASLQATIPEL